jgi:hypothetical protein
VPGSQEPVERRQVDRVRARDLRELGLERGDALGGKSRPDRGEGPFDARPGLVVPLDGHEDI